MKRRRSLVLLGFASLGAFSLAAGRARADTVITTSGQRISGKVISEDDDKIRIRTDKGPIVTVNRDEIASISKEKPEETYARKLKKLADDDVAGLLALAQWCKENKLPSQATECWEKVLKTDTENAEAREALGWGKVDGKWFKGDDLKRAHGLVEYQGRWVSEEEKALLDQGFVKRHGVWLSKDEADQEDNWGIPRSGAGTAEPPPRPDPPAPRPEPAKPKDTPAPKPPKPDPPKPDPVTPPAPPPKSTPPPPPPSGGPKGPSAQPNDLPADEKELLKKIDSGPDASRIEAIRTLMAKGDQQKNTAMAEVERCLEGEKKNLLDYVKREKLNLRGRMGELIVERRQAALDFIRDKNRYPEENHGAVGQPEVDRLIASLRQAWQDPLRELKGSDKKITTGLAEVRKIASWMETIFGLKVDGDKLEQELAKATNDIVQSSKLPVDDKDAGIFARSLGILKWNETAPGTSTKEEKDGVLATNEYRMMLGLLALKIHEPLVQAGRKHSQDMKDHGYFAHDSPTEGTAAQRVQKEGARYTGENIASGVTTGRAAFEVWFHSSGHHRNILGAHRSMGLGQVGDLWTEDFGTDDPQ